jgi:formylglycine-generating enzyme required for sulfatase activity
MRRKNWELLVASVAIASLWGLISAVHAQTSQPAAKGAKTSRPAAQSSPDTSDKPYDWKPSFAAVPVGKVPRMPDGKPSLQGIWSRAILTPLERRDGQQRTEISAAEAEEDENAAQQSAINLRVEPTVTPLGEKTTDAYNSYWRDGYWFKIPMTTLHTSQVVDPPNGHIPPLTAAARKRRDEDFMRLNRPATGPEDRPLSSRCIRPMGVGPAFTGSGPGGQEATLQIVQGPDVVTVRVEALESQLIYLDGRPRPPENVRMNMGAARGHWEGDTLVVESTNFRDSGTRDGTQRMHLTERWKRLDDTHMLYGFTVDDPDTWTKPWSVEFIMWRLTDQEQLVEYACHEGNVGIEFTLSAARSREKAAETAALQPVSQPSEPVRTQPHAAIHSTVVASALLHSTNNLGMEFVALPPGEFLMGCSEEPPHEKLSFPTSCNKDEKPARAVQITKGFEIQKTELTQKQWVAIMGTNPSAHKGDLDLPVDQVSYSDVQQFLTKLNASNDGHLYRLPTEAEWEYAARGGTGDPYAGPLLDTAWYHDDAAAARGTGSSTNEGGVPIESHPVATKKSNDWGIYDMRGNVSEWVQDWYGADYYSTAPTTDPKGPATGDSRVVRGGSYHVYPWLTTVSVRTPFPEGYEFNDLGFRIVREKR